MAFLSIPAAKPMGLAEMNPKNAARADNGAKIKRSKVGRKKRHLPQAEPLRSLSLQSKAAGESRCRSSLPMQNVLKISPGSPRYPPRRQLRRQPQEPPVAARQLS